MRRDNLGEVRVKGLRNTYLVSVCERPIIGAARTLRVPAGRSLADEVAAHVADPVLRSHVVVRINGVEIDRVAWAATVPRPGTLVEIGVRPHRGGGSNPLRLILQIALVAATAWIGGGGLVGLFGTWAGSSIGAAVLAGAAGVLGSYAINAIAPPPQAGFAQRGAGEAISPTYFLQGARNQNRLGQVVPKVLGRHRMVPPLGAKFYTESAGGEIYLRGLLCWGVGPVQISDLKTGDTPFADLNPEIEHALGFADDEPLTLYPRAVDEIEGGGELDAAAGYVRRTTSDDAVEISIDIDFPQGLTQIDAQTGAKQERSVQLDIRYAPADDAGEPVGSWSYERVDVAGANASATAQGGNRLALPDFGITYEDWYGGLPGGGGGTAFGAWTISRATRQPFRVNTSWAVPKSEYGYVVEVRRVTANSADDLVLDVCNWSVLRSISANPPVLAEGVALTAFRVRATGQFNGVLDNINATVESVVDTYQAGEGWTGGNPAFSNNNADLLNEVLAGAANARPIGSARTGWASLEKFWQHCDDNAFTFNHVVDYDASVESVVQAICAAGRARAFWNGPRLDVAIDAVKPVRQALSGRSVRSYRGRISFPGALHGVRIPFNNEDQGWHLDERVVYAPGYDASNATRIETLELVGKTDPAEIFKEGEFHIASAIAQAGEAHEIIVDADMPGITLGERFLFSHDVPLSAAVAGRVTALATDGAGDVTAITLDEYVESEAGKSYGLRWKYAVEDPDATGGGSYVYEVSDTLAVTPAAQRSRVLDLSSPVDPADAPQIGDEVLFGLAGEETLDLLVLDIDNSGDDAVRITGIPYAPTRHTGTVPPSFSTKVTQGYTPRPPKPVLTGIVPLPEGLAIDFRHPSGSQNPAVQTEVRWRETPAEGVTADYDVLPALAAESSRLVTPAVDHALTYDIELTAVASDGKRSEPLVIAAVPGALSLPDPENVTATGVTLDAPSGAKIPALRVTADGVTDSRAADFVIETKPAGADASEYRVVGTAPAGLPSRDIRAVTGGQDLDVKVYFRGHRPFGTTSANPVEVLGVEIPDELVATNSTKLGGVDADLLKGKIELGAQLSLLNWLADPLFETGVQGWETTGGGMVMPIAGNPRAIQTMWDFDNSGRPADTHITWPERRKVSEGQAVQVGVETGMLSDCASAVVEVVWLDEDGAELSASEVASGSSGRLTGIVTAPQDAVQAFVRMAPVASAAGKGGFIIRRPLVAYALPGQEDVDTFAAPENELVARIAYLERIVGGVAQTERNLAVETRRGRAGYRENQQAIVDETGARVSAIAALEASYQAADASLQSSINARATITYVDQVIATESSARATAISQIEANFEAADAALQTAIDARATITYVNDAIATEQGARATAISQIEAAYQSADAGLQTDIDARATIVYVNDAIATEQGARASAISTLEANYQAADASLQSSINARATITYVDQAVADESSARATAISDLTADFNGLEASVITNASAIANLEGASAIYEILVAAGGGVPAIARLLAGVGGSEVLLAASRVMLANLGAGEDEYEAVLEAVGGEAFFSRAIHIDDGNGTPVKRLIIGPNTNWVMWLGAANKTAATATLGNCDFALTTGGEIYLGGELATAGGKILGTAIQQANQSDQLSADLSFGTSWTQAAKISFDDVILAHAFLFEGTRITTRSTSRGTGAANDEGTINWEIRLHTDGNEDIYANGLTVESGAIPITEIGGGTNLYWSNGGDIGLWTGFDSFYKTITGTWDTYPKTHWYVLWVRIGSGPATTGYLDGVDIPTRLEATALAPQMAKNPS